MCCVSMVLDWGRQTPVHDYTTDQYRQLMDLLERAKQYDVKTNQPDCEDPAKVDYLKQILERLTQIEKRLDLQDEMLKLRALFGLGPLGPNWSVAGGGLPSTTWTAVGVAGGGAQPSPFPPTAINTEARGLPSAQTASVQAEARRPMTFGDGPASEDYSHVNSGYCPACGDPWAALPCEQEDHRNYGR